MAEEGICKGRTYGTVAVDLERRRVIDLLPDRTSAATAEWLQQRRGVKVAARDRSTEYARAVAIGAPRAVQVADRWHLLANMRQALERWLHTVHARLRRLAPANGGGATDHPAVIKRSAAPGRSGRHGQSDTSAGRCATRRLGGGTSRASR